MTTICEPFCRGLSHEKVNSGFIYGLSLAFPNEKLRFYADATHIEAIKRILKHDNIIIENIEYLPTRFGNHLSWFSIITYYFIFLRLLRNILDSGETKIFFLSFTPEMLFIIKKLKESKFNSLKCTFVLHGAFESVASDLPLDSAITLPRKIIVDPYEQTGMLEKLRRSKPTEIPVKLLRKVVSFLPGFQLNKLWARHLTVKKYDGMEAFRRL